MPSNAAELMRMMVVREPDPKAQRPTILLMMSPKLAGITNRLDYNRAREALRKFGASPANIFLSVRDVPHAEKLEMLRNLALAESPDRSVDELVQAAFGQPANQVVKLQGWSVTLRRLADSIIYHKLAYMAGPRPLSELADLYRSAMLVESVVGEGQPAVPRDLLNAPLALPPVFSPGNGSTDRAGADALETRREKAAEVAIERVREMIELSEKEQIITKALNEVASIPINASNFAIAPTATMTAGSDEAGCSGAGETPDPGRTEIDSLAVNWSLMRNALTSTTRSTILGAPRPGLKLTNAAVKAIAPEIRKVIADEGLKIGSDPIERIADTLVAKRDSINAARAALNSSSPATNGWLGGVSVSRTPMYRPEPKAPPIKLPPNIRIPDGIHIDWDNVLVDSGWPGQPPQPEPEQDLGPSLLKPTGLGELFVIRQHITGYRSGEVSHVENVLPGETRERHHRRLRQQEDTTTEEQERTQEDEKSLQTTTRAELEREVQSTIKKQFDYGASAQVSGDYGKIEFTASGQVAGSSASEIASKTAQKLASEVVEISRQKITERVRSERTRRVLEEVEETNLHKLSGEKLTAPLNGVYQWIDKVYVNEVWSYGSRTMYEVVVPEPASGLIAAATMPGAQSSTLVERPAPLNIMIDALSPSRVGQLCVQYGVTEDFDPFPEPIIVSVAFSQSSDDNASNNFYAETKDVDVPEGYEMLDGWIAVRARGEDQTPMIGVTVGTASHRFFTQNIKYDNQNDTIPVHFQFNFESERPIVKQLQAAVAIDDYSAFAISVMLRFRPSPAHIDAWRRKAFSAIRGAYDARMAEWREYQTQIDYEKPELSEKLFGKNPETNRSLARQELQRSAIEVFRNLSLDFDLVREGSGQDPVPRSDFPSLRQTSPEILFLSQAFEWSNMTFILYPYFFGRRREWTLKMQFSDLDANFVEFLKSGAARVQVPARPGFEAAIDHYMMTREPYFGQGLPEIGDELYLPYLDEARESMGAGLGGVHRPDLDFEVTVPTTLVVARNNEKIDTEGGTLPAWAKSGEIWKEVPVQ